MNGNQLAAHQDRLREIRQEIDQVETDHAARIKPLTDELAAIGHLIGEDDATGDRVLDGRPLVGYGHGKTDPGKIGLEKIDRDLPTYASRQLWEKIRPLLDDALRTLSKEAMSDDQDVIDTMVGRCYRNRALRTRLLEKVIIVRALRCFIPDLEPDTVDRCGINIPTALLGYEEVALADIVDPDESRKIRAAVDMLFDAGLMPGVFRAPAGGLLEEAMGTFNLSHAATVLGKTIAGWWRGASSEGPRDKDEIGPGVILPITGKVTYLVIPQEVNNDFMPRGTLGMTRDALHHVFHALVGEGKMDAQDMTGLLTLETKARMAMDAISAAGLRLPFSKLWPHGLGVMRTCGPRQVDVLRLNLVRELGAVEPYLIIAAPDIIDSLRDLLKEPVGENSAIPAEVKRFLDDPEVRRIRITPEMRLRETLPVYSVQEAWLADAPVNAEPYSQAGEVPDMDIPGMGPVAAPAPASTRA